MHVSTVFKRVNSPLSKIASIGKGTKGPFKYLPIPPREEQTVKAFHKCDPLFPPSQNR